MKIVHISTLHQPFDQRIFYRECISLKKAGFEVVLLVSLDESEISHEGVKFISLGTQIKKRTSLRLLSRIRYIITALFLGLRTKADVYHIHDPELLIIVPVLKLLSKAKLIYDCHEDNIGFMHQKQHVPVYLRKSLSKFMEILERYSTYFLDAIITADPGVENKFQKFGKKTLTLYNFPRIDLFSLPPFHKKEYDLVYHGSIPRYHMEACFAIDEALIKRNREVKWLFIGSYGDKDWIEKQITARSIGHRFTLKNRIQHNKIAYEVRKARLGIIPLPDLPKFQHNIPTKLFEFMLLEMPVVMSDLPPSRIFVKNDEFAIMVKPDDYDSYAKAIIELLNNDDLRIQMGNTGRIQVENNFNWANEENKLINFYQCIRDID